MQINTVATEQLMQIYGEDVGSLSTGTCLDRGCSRQENNKNPVQQG